VSFLHLYYNVRGTINGLKNWVDYLFPTLDGTREEIQVLKTDEHIAAMMASSEHGEIVLEEDVSVYEIGDSFKSFHHRSSLPMSRCAQLVGFMSVWLKKFVVPSFLHYGILPKVLLPAVQLVYRRALGLLPAIV